MIKNALDHLQLFEDAEENTDFEWPTLLNQHASYIFKNIGTDKKINKINKINKKIKKVKKQSSHQTIFSNSALSQAV